MKPWIVTVAVGLLLAGCVAHMTPEVSSKSRPTPADAATLTPKPSSQEAFLGSGGKNLRKDFSSLDELFEPYTPYEWPLEAPAPHAFHDIEVATPEGWASHLIQYSEKATTPFFNAQIAASGAIRWIREYRNAAAVYVYETNGTGKQLSSKALLEASEGDRAWVKLRVAKFYLPERDKPLAERIRDAEAQLVGRFGLVPIDGLDAIYRTHAGSEALDGYASRSFTLEVQRGPFTYQIRLSHHRETSAADAPLNLKLSGLGLATLRRLKWHELENDLPTATAEASIEATLEQPPASP